MAESPPETYSPRFAPHVVGTFNRRLMDPDTREPTPQHIKMVCGTCKATAEFRCTSGLVRKRIGQFALMHMHTK